MLSNHFKIMLSKSCVGNKSSWFYSIVSEYHSKISHPIIDEEQSKLFYILFLMKYPYHNSYENFNES